MVDHDKEEIGTSFLRFCLVGGAGFVADAIVLLMLVHGFSVHPLLARIFSFSIAVALTFHLNRLWTFGSQQYVPSAFGAYLGVQGVGFVCNLAIYTLALLVLQLPPILCLMIASAVALIINYTGAKRLVFHAGY